MENKQLNKKQREAFRELKKYIHHYDYHDDASRFTSVTLAKTLYQQMCYANLDHILDYTQRDEIFDYIKNNQKKSNPRPYNKISSIRKLSQYKFINHCHKRALNSGGKTGHYWDDKLSGTDLFVISSRRTDNTILIGIDIDDAGGGSDATRACLDWVQAQTGSRWAQPSRGHTGQHAWLKIKVQDSDPNKLISNKLLSTILLRIKKELARLNPVSGAKVCTINGNPTSLKYNVIPVTRGNLLLAPRLDTIEKCDSFLNWIREPAISLSSLCEKLNVSMLTTSQVAELSHIFADSNMFDGELDDCSYTLSPLSLSHAGTYTASGQKLKNPSEDVFLSKLREEPPNERVSHFTYFLARKLKRVPTPNEVAIAYEQENLNTGADDGNRTRRIQNAITACATTFDISKCENETTRLVKQFCTQEIINKNTSHRMSVSMTDLSLALSLIKFRITTKQVKGRDPYTVSYDYARAVWTGLNRIGLTTTSLRKERWAALKRILIEAKLIKRTVKSSVKAKLGEQFALGENYNEHTLTQKRTDRIGQALDGRGRPAETTGHSEDSQRESDSESGKTQAGFPEQSVSRSQSETLSGKNAGTLQDLCRGSPELPD